MNQQLLFPLPGSAAFAEQQFEEFCAEHLRPLSHGRVEASVLREAYTAWGASRCAAPMGFKQLKALMRRRGFRHFYSNRAWYGGVTLLTLGEEVDPCPSTAAPAPQLFALDLLARIDAISADIERSAAELTLLRRRLLDAVQ